jgi:hypothetical protein
MQNWLIYWAYFWEEVSDDENVVNDKWYTKQTGFGERVGADDVLWVITSGGERASNEWRLLQRIVVRSVRHNARDKRPYEIIGDAAKGEKYNLDSQADLAPLLKKLEFESGKRIVGKGAVIGQRLQANRPMTEDDGLLLQSYANDLLPHLPRDVVSARRQQKSRNDSTNPTRIDEKAFLEGERRAATTISRSAALRRAAKRHWGLACYCCGFEFGIFYGARRKGFAIVHHIETFAKEGSPRHASVECVRIVCANCHYVIHLENPPLDVDELKNQIGNSWSYWSKTGVSPTDG